MNFSFWFYNEFRPAFVAGINLTACTGKTIAAASVTKVPFKRCTAIMTE